MQQWIRIAATSRLVSDEVYNNLEAWNEANVDDVLLVLDFNSADWLTADIRRSFVTPCPANKILGWPSEFTAKYISFSNLPDDAVASSNKLLQ
jgi:hypothetical protein